MQVDLGSPFDYSVSAPAFCAMSAIISWVDIQTDTNDQKPSSRLYLHSFHQNTATFDYNTAHPLNTNSTPISERFPAAA